MRLRGASCGAGGVSVRAENTQRRRRRRRSEVLKHAEKVFNFQARREKRKEEGGTETGRTGRSCGSGSLLALLQGGKIAP
jgi:hypothetical protein